MAMQSFSGSHFDIGEQMGKIYRANGMDFANVKVNRDLFEGQLAVYRKHYPDCLAELAGMAQGGGFNMEKLSYSFICGELEWFAKYMSLQMQCTLFGVKSAGALHVGRNYDWYPQTEGLVQAYRCRNPPKHSYVAVTDMGALPETAELPGYHFYNPDDAINDAGLYIGLTFAYASEWSYGLVCTDMIKLLAETCRTVDDALRVFEKTPVCCPKNYFIADKAGDMAVVEHTSKRHAVIRPKDGLLVQTNHYVDSELAKQEKAFVINPLHNTRMRYDEVCAKVAAKHGGLSQDGVVEILRAPRSQVFQNNRFKTIWTLSLDMTRGEYKLYQKNCGNQTVTVLIP